MRLCALILMLATAGGAAPAPALAADAPRFVVVAHPALPVSSVSKDELSRVFLKKTAAWEGGLLARPVDQAAEAPVRAAFSEKIHDRSVAAVKSYWQRLIFSGRGVPPPEAAGDEAVLKHVRATPGSVGYVSPQAKPTGVKVLAVTG